MQQAATNMQFQQQLQQQYNFKLQQLQQMNKYNQINPILY